MPKMVIPWPTTALPGERPGEGQGDLVNCYACKVGENLEIRRTPGLRRLLELPVPAKRTPRGMVATASRLYHAWDNELWYRNTSGTDAKIINALPGTDPVTFAINIRQNGPQLIVVSSIGAYLIDQNTDTLVPYPDAKLPYVTSVEYAFGYFFFVSPTNSIIASDLQNTDIPDNSQAEAEYSSDPLLRLVAAGSSLLAMGTRTIEVWSDAGTLPFPLGRQTTLDTGLLGPWCVAGGSNTWGNGVFWCANDYTVRVLDGLNPKPISNLKVAADLFAYRGAVDQIFCSVHDFEQQAVFTIATKDWTWEYNLVTNCWHRRDSYGLPTWRARFSCNWGNRWYVQDTKAGRILQVMVREYEEDGDRLRFRAESAPLKQFPSSARIPSVDFDMTNALGDQNVPSPYQTNPAVMVSWSKDGGATWSRPIARSLGRIGRYAQKVTVNGLGRSTPQGLRIRAEVIDPVPAILRGAWANRAKFSGPRQVET